MFHGCHETDKKLMKTDGRSESLFLWYTVIKTWTDIAHTASNSGRSLWISLGMYKHILLNKTLKLQLSLLFCSKGELLRKTEYIQSI